MEDIRIKQLMKEFVLNDSQLREVYKRICMAVHQGLSRDTHARSEIKCYVTYVQDLPTGKEVGNYLALDLGGTNFRVLMVTLKGQLPAEVDSKIYAVPKEIMVGPGKQLFDHIAKCLAEFVNEHNVSGSELPLGFTFSFPCVQLGLEKGTLVRWTKGFQCSGVEGKDVALLLKEAIARRDDLEINVMAILNDTTGTLMSCAHRNTACRIGVIIGTGCNACYVENVDKVETLESKFKVKKKQVIINTEWGAFGEKGSLNFIRTDFDRLIDSTSLNAGHQIYEKMISGMYLGDLVRVVLHKAVADQIIFVKNNKNEQLLKALNEPGCFQTNFISDIETDTSPEFPNTRTIIKNLFDIDKADVEECQKVKFICECIAKRAAHLAAMGISFLINRVNERKVVVGIDGSVYRFHPKFDAYMREAMAKFVDSKIQFDLMLSEDGSGRGAALVAAVAATN